ncbi:MAG TPA: hypothetical protein VNA69_05930 [Thermoanaerobaculia bacterium]|nr:hypothetical protein [Thermoanaerobaculia bacterium]
MNTVLLAGIGIVAFMGSVASVISLYADVARHPVREWSGVPRVMTAVGLFVVSVAAGLAAYRAAPRPDNATTSSGSITVSAPATESTQVAAPQPADHSQPSPASLGTPARPVVPRLRIADASGASIPQLVAAAKDLRHEYALEGVLLEQSEQAPELQDLYTVHLTLNATITEGRGVVAAFSLRSRGGGFQIEAARAQALDRLATALQERLAEVP